MATSYNFLDLTKTLSTDELKVLALRNKIKYYGSFSREKLIEKLSEIPDLSNDFEVKIDKPISELSHIEKRVLAQRVGIKNIRKIPQIELDEILKNIDIQDIKPKPVRPQISVRKPLLQQVKEKGHKNFQNLNIEKLKELLNKEPVNKILKSDLFKQAKELGIEVKNNMRKSFIQDLIQKHGEFKEFKKVKSAFKGYANHFRMQGLPKIGVKSYLEKIKPILKEKINQQNKVGLKINIVLHVSMKRKTEVQEFQLRSTHILGVDEEVDYEELIENMLLELKNLVQKGSGWVFLEITKVDIHTVNHTPFSGSSYIPLPEFIQKKLAVINVQNKDQKCFRYSVEAALLNLPKNTERVSNYNKPEFDHMFEGLEFPVKIDDIKIFEKKNENLGVNVFTFIKKKFNNKVFYDICPRRISDKILEESQYINLLYYKSEEATEEDEQIEDISDNINYHYAWIKNFSRLASAGISKHKCAVKICFRCMKTISAETSELRDKRFAEHLELCKKFECVKVSVPNLKNNILKFKDLKMTQKHPVVITADFESTLKKITKNIGEKTIQTQEHVPNSFSFYVAFDKDQIKAKNLLVEHSISDSNENIGARFCEEIEKVVYKIHDKFFSQVKPMKALSEEQQQDYKEAEQCYLCNEDFTDKNYKVRDHNHFNGKYRGAACNECNLKFKVPNFIPVYFHNLSGYDAHLFVKNLAGDLSVLAKNSEDYISFSKSLPIEGDKSFSIRFLDSYRLMQCSLANLASNLPDSEKKYVATHFKDEKFDLLTRKGVYPYEWVDSHSKLNAKELPTIEEFDSKFNNTKISQEDYLHAQKVWKTFECKTFREYHELYLKTDVLLLADIIENFRNVCMGIYNLDPVWNYSSPGLTWQAMLKKTEVELELLTDIDMYNFFEQGIRGGICQASHRYAKAEEGKSTITYLDANNLYGLAMSQKLPSGNFKWMSPTDLKKWKLIPCTLEVDLEYVKHLHDLHNDLPLAPEHINGKLIPNLQDKEHYIVHHEMLKFYLAQGLKLKKIHRGISYTESYFLKEYIDLNTTKRANAKNDFEKDFFKLMNNSCFGKTMESVRNRKNISLATNAKQLRKHVNSNNYRSHKIFDENLVMIEMQKSNVYLNKPIFLGQAVLDLSKMHMYNFHYNHIKKKYPGKAQLCYCDTDSLVYHIQTEDIYKDMQEDSDLYDFSNFPKEHDIVF